MAVCTCLMPILVILINLFSFGLQESDSRPLSKYLDRSLSICHKDVTTAKKLVGTLHSYQMLYLSCTTKQWNECLILHKTRVSHLNMHRRGYGGKICHYEKVILRNVKKFQYRISVLHYFQINLTFIQFDLAKLFYHYCYGHDIMVSIMCT